MCTSLKALDQTTDKPSLGHIYKIKILATTGCELNINIDNLHNLEEVSKISLNTCKSPHINIYRNFGLAVRIICRSSGATGKQAGCTNMTIFCIFVYSDLIPAECIYYCVY